MQEICSWSSRFRVRGIPIALLIDAVEKLHRDLKTLALLRDIATNFLKVFPNACRADTVFGSSRVFFDAVWNRLTDEAAVSGARSIATDRLLRSLLRPRTQRLDGARTTPRGWSVED